MTAYRINMIIFLTAIITDINADDHTTRATTAILIIVTIKMIMPILLMIQI